MDVNTAAAYKILQEVFKQLNDQFTGIIEAQAMLRNAIAMLETGNWENPPGDFRWDAPVGTPEERAAPMGAIGKPRWPGHWEDMTGFAVLYSGGKGYHPSADLNLNYPKAFSDVKAPVYAPADGVVVYVGRASGWQLAMVVIKHQLKDGTYRWSRLAHLGTTQVNEGQIVKRGAQIGTIGDYTPTNDPRGDHLDYGICRKDLEDCPEDWPGMDKERLLRDYEDPLTFTQERHNV